MKATKKPIEVEAFIWTGDQNQKEDPEWIVEAIEKGTVEIIGHHDHGFATSLLIKTLEGDIQARKGDWIIRGVNGEIYPCKPDIFEKTYNYEKTAQSLRKRHSPTSRLSIIQSN